MTHRNKILPMKKVELKPFKSDRAIKQVKILRISKLMIRWNVSASLRRDSQYVINLVIESRK